MNGSSNNRIKRVIGWIGAILLALIGAVGLLLCLCGLLVWLVPDGDVESGRACFFIGLVWFVLFAVPALLLMRILRKKATKPPQETPANGTFGERMKRMGGCGCAALVGMCMACAFVTVMGLGFWLGVEGEQTFGMVTFFGGLASLLFFVGIGLVLPYVQWKKGVDVPEGTPAVIAVPMNEPEQNEEEPSYDEASPVKNRVINAGSVVVLVLTAIGVCLFGGFGVEIIKTAEEYRRVYDNPLIVSGVIYDHDSYDDDGDTDYRSYVRYQVNGTTYTEKYQDEDKSAELVPIGTQVTFEVSPEHPDKLLSFMDGKSSFVIVILLLILAAIAFVYTAWLHGKRVGGRDAYMDNDTVRQNLMLTIFGRFRMVFWLLAALGSVFLVWRYPMLFGTRTLEFAAACFGVWVISLILAVRDFVCVQHGEYEVRRDVLVEKRIISDEDGTIYRLTYRSSHNGQTWKVNVKSTRYHREREGNTVHAVYIKGKKKPTMHYDTQGDVE